LSIFSKSSYPTEHPVNTSSWSVIWFNALRRPFVSTYEEFIRDPEAKPQRAYIWVVVTSLVAGYIITYNPYRPTTAMSFGQASIAIIVASLFALVSIILYAGIGQIIGARLSGTGTYAQLIFAFAAFHAPLTILRGVFIASPILVVISLAYGFGLTAIAVKAVHKFSWGRTLVTTVAVLVSSFLILALLAWLFHSIRQNNVTPTSFF